MDEITDWHNIYDDERKTLNLSQRDLKTLPYDIIKTYGSCVQQIDLSHNRLSDLSWLPEFESLEELILDNNRLCETHLKRLSTPSENITILMLNKNEFLDLNETIDHLYRLFPNLEHLSLHGNAICPDGLGLRPFSTYVNYDYKHYRSFIISALPKLKFLDHASIETTKFYDVNLEDNHREKFKTPSLLWRKFNLYLKSTYSRVCKTSESNTVLCSQNTYSDRSNNEGL